MAIYVNFNGNKLYFCSILFLFVGLYLDSEAAMDFLISRPDINKDKIVVFGRSLGGAVAAWLASSKKYSPHIAALVLENTFTSLPDIAKSIFADLFILEYIPVFLFKNKVRNIYLHEFGKKFMLIM